MSHLPCSKHTGHILRQLSLTTLLLSLLTNTQASELVVIAEANSPLTSLSKEQIAEIFLGRISMLPSGGTAELIDQAENSPLREEFYSRVTGKSAAQAKAFWSRLAFTGKGAPPRTGNSHADIKKMLQGNPRALAYIEKSALDSSVKVLYSAP